MKIAFVSHNLITCGGIIVLFEYVKELRKRGIEADIYSESGNEDLERTYNIHPKRTCELGELTDDDILIAVRWEQCEDLLKYKGRKIQFVQGNDTYYYESVNHADLQKMKDTRNDARWGLMGVSAYALKEWKRGFVVPNGISERFFIDYGLERDIDALIEGNNEPNKNIEYTIYRAKQDGHKKIVWMGRETKKIEGVETITNPPQEEIPQIYQRAKHFYKYSHSEGFSLPILEAKASGCIIHTHDMGHNFPEDVDPKQYTWENAVNIFLDYVQGDNGDEKNKGIE